jgi:TRAP-type transport system periplasmic protein
MKADSRYKGDAFAYLFAVIVVYLILSTSCQKKEADVFIFRLGHLANEDNTWHLAAIYFDSLLNVRTEGRIRVDVFPNEQLGKEIEMIRSIQAGITDMTITAGTLQNWCNLAAFTDMPFLLRDTVHLQKLADGEIGKSIEKIIHEQTGLRIICYFQRGPRYLTSNRPIQNPSDLKGLIVRVPNVPSYVTAWQALGAKPTPMAFSEVFTSLQQGTVEAQENPLAMIRSANFSEVQSYLNLTEHVISWVYVVIGERQFMKMPEEYRQIFLETARDMQAYEHRLFLEKEKHLWQELKDAGMKFNEVDNDAFRKIGSEAIYKSLDDEMKHYYLKIRDL